MLLLISCVQVTLQNTPGPDLQVFTFDNVVNDAKGAILLVTSVYTQVDNGFAEVFFIVESNRGKTLWFSFLFHFVLTILDWIDTSNFQGENDQYFFLKQNTR